VIRRLALAALFAALAPWAPAQAAPVRPLEIAPLAYRVDAAATLGRAKVTLDVVTTLTVTAPAGGMERLTIGVAARRFGAWADRSLSVDGVARPFAWANRTTMRLELDLAEAPWAAGSTHTVRIAGRIDWRRSSDDQGMLRRIRSGGRTILTFGDMLPMPMEDPRSEAFSDPLSAPVAEEVRFSLHSILPLAAASVIASGERVAGPGSGTGHDWTFAIAPSRSFALVIAEGYRTSARSVAVSDPSGATRTMVVSAHGTSAAQRRADLDTAAAAVAAIEGRFGQGPYGRLRVVAVPGVGFAHEFPGMVLIGGKFSGASRRHIVRHEVAHQWWDVLVATDQGDDPWMDETLTEWSALGLSGLRVRSTSCTRPIDGPNRPTAGYYTVFFGAGNYWDCVYLRGPRLFVAVARALGAARLDACLADYAQGHRFASPPPAALVSALRGCAESAGESAAVEAALARYLSAGTLGR